MRQSLFPLALLSALLAPPALASEDEFYQFGTNVCWTLLGDGIDGIDQSTYTDALTRSDVDYVDYCGCVGTVFSLQSEEQGPIMQRFADTELEIPVMQFFIKENLQSCLPSDNGEEIGLDPFHPDYDLSEDMGDQGDEPSDWLGYDPEDAMTCVEVIHGNFPARGFDAERFRAVIASGALDVSATCTCAAQWMEEQGEALDDAIAASGAPGVEWGTAIGRGIDACTSG